MLITRARLTLFSTALFSLGAVAFALPSINPSTSLVSQKGRGGGGHSSGGGGGRSSGGGGQAHADRTSVRTRNFVPRAGAAPAMPRRPDLPTPPKGPATSRPQARPNTPAIVTQRKFTKTPQGRKYDNGLTLRHGLVPTTAWQHHYFPHGHYHFPFYRPTFIAGSCFISPFGFYFGICVPYISASVCFAYPPSVTFIDIPTYNGYNCTGFSDAGDPNYLNDQNLDQEEPGLNAALSQLTETFQNGNIDGLVSLIDPNMRIAIYLRGQYQYSMNANDFVDLTRDTIQSTQTISFLLTYLHQRSPSVYSACGVHMYRDANGNSRSVYVSFVLQDIGGQWTLTQVGTSPDVIQNI